MVLLFYSPKNGDRSFRICFVLIFSGAGKTVCTNHDFFIHIMRN